MNVFSLTPIVERNGKSYRGSNQVTAVSCGNPQCDVKIWRQTGMLSTRKTSFCSIMCRHAAIDPIGSKIMQKRDDPDFYYLVGLIATDGYLRPNSYNVEINLSQFDDSSVDLLRDIASKFGGVVNYWGQKSPTVNWTIINIDYYNYLLSIGITNKNKSFDLDVTDWFKDLKEERKYAFLRGCLDGDGSIYLRPVPKTQKRPFLLSVSITSASKSFIKMMSESVNGNIHYPKNKKYMTINIYALAAQTLLDKVYREGTGNLKLDRKFERFAKFKQQCIPY